MARKPEHIINDQVHIWEHRRAMAARGETPPRLWPVITISREFGALGTSLATLLARQTGFTVWDSELVQAIAVASGGDERVLRTLDERRRTAIEDAVHATLQHGRHTNLVYLHSLLRVVQGIAAHGNALLVGRGANYICRPETALNVRVVCPLGLRARRYAATQGLDEREALRVVEQRDAERTDYIRYYFHRDPGTPSDYDLVLNSGSYAMDQLAGLVLHAYETKFGQRPPEPSAVSHGTLEAV